jgi:tetratricopeptide (TPR) repeat protein
MPDAYVFLSYSSTEADFARNLASDLEHAGIHVWVDRPRIAPGSDWNDTLRKAVNECTAFVAIVSPAYVASEYCNDELARAARLGKPRFPLFLRVLDDMARDWPVHLEGIQYLDFTESQQPALYRDSVAKLVKVLAPILHEPERAYLDALIIELSKQVPPAWYVDLSAQGEKSGDDGSAARINGRIGWRTSGIDPYFRRKPVPDTLSSRSEFDTLESVFLAVQRYPRFVLLGAPGSGKTETLKHLAREAARRRLEDQTAPIPVFLDLSSWHDDVGPLDFLRDKVPAFMKSWLSDGLARGDILLYLDGLNEMGLKQVEKAKQLNDSMRSHVQRLIVTCRTDDFQGELHLDLPQVEIEPLDNDRIKEFATKYLANQAAAFLDDILVSSEEQTHNWTELARNPFLLKCLMDGHTALGGNLPANAGELVRALAQYLLDREEERGTLDWMQPDSRGDFKDQLKASLARLGFSISRERRSQDVPFDWALRQILGKSWLDQVTAADKQRAQRIFRVGKAAMLLDVRDGTSVRFHHQLIQEYFAAEALLASPVSGFLETPAVPYFDVHQESDGSLSVSCGRSDGWWDQVVMMLFGIVNSNRDKLLDSVLKIDPHLAARCVASDASDQGDAFRKVVIERLINTLHYPLNRDAQWIGTINLENYHEYWLRNTEYDEAVLKKRLPSKEELTRAVVFDALHYLGRDAIPAVFSLLKTRGALQIKAAICLLRIGKPVVDFLLGPCVEADSELREIVGQILAGIAESTPSFVHGKIGEIDRLLAQRTEVASLHLQKAELLAALGEHGRALASFDATRALDPSHPVAFAGAMRSLIALKQDAQALEWYAEAVERGVHSASTCLLAGHIHFDVQRFGDALLAYERAAKIEPDRFDVHLALGNAYIENKQFDLALSAYRRAASIERDSAMVQSAIARAYYSLQDFDKAANAYVHALSLPYDSYAAEGLDHGNLGLCYAGLARHREAIECFLRAAKVAQDVKMEDDEAFWLDEVGWSYRELKMYAEAVEAFSRAIQLASASGDSDRRMSCLDGLGRCLDALKNVEGAVQTYLDGLSIARETNNKQYKMTFLRYLGIDYSRLGRIDSARGCHEEELSIARDVGERLTQSLALGGIGLRAVELGNLELAMQCHEDALAIAVDLGDKQGEAGERDNLGACEYFRGNHQAAFQYFQTALKLVLHHSEFDG